MEGLKFIHSTANAEAPVAYCSFTAMHTKFEALFVEEDEAKARSACNGIKKLAVRLEDSLSRHKVEGDLYRLNNEVVSVELNPDLFFSLELCEQMRAATRGYFDIAALSRSRCRPAYETNGRDHCARRLDRNIKIDLGGFAKGYALEKMKDLLSGEYEVENAILNFGNSSVLGMGHHPLGDCWMVSPAKEGVEKTFRLCGEALSLSGRTAGVREHIIDPLTGCYASKDGDVAVTGPSALVSEILSTALYAAPKTEWNEILSLFKSYKAEEI